MQTLEPLSPFRAEPWLEGIWIQAGARWHKGMLSLVFVLKDPGASLLIPEPSTNPERRDGLWESTCFEAFFAVAGEAAYWEVNLSPSGHWNVYRLDDYRQGLRPEPAVTSLPHALQRGSGELELQWHLSLDALIAPDRDLELSLTAVLDQPAHGCSFWAWDHISPQADFHQRGSFRRLIPDPN